MSRPVKLLFLDTETTGTDLEHSSIWQIGAIMEIDGKIIDKCNIKMRPYKKSKISRGLLEKLGLTIEMLKGFQIHEEGLKEFKAFLEKHIDQFDKYDKAHILAYNAHFDTHFLRKMFSDCNDNFYGSWFWSNPIDIMTLTTMSRLETRHMMPNFKLGTVCKDFRIDISDDELHDASYDIQKTYELYKMIMGD